MTAPAGGTREFRWWKLTLWAVAFLIVATWAVGWWLLGSAGHHVIPGILAERRRDWNEAIRHYTLVYERKPDALMIAHDIACCYARKGDQHQAIAWLKRALETSYADYARKWARTEGAFDSIRESEEFKALVPP